MIQGREQFSAIGTLSVREPGWVSVAIGAVTGGLIGGGALGGLALLAGLAIAPGVIAGIAGFFALVLLMGFGLSAGSPVSTPHLMSVVISLGHAILFGAFGFAVLMPEMAAPVVASVAQLPFLSGLSEGGSQLLTVGPIFLLSLVAYSVLAPVSLMIFRYISFRK